MTAPTRCPQESSDCLARKASSAETWLARASDTRMRFDADGPTQVERLARADGGHKREGRGVSMTCPAKSDDRSSCSRGWRSGFCGGTVVVSAPLLVGTSLTDFDWASSRQPPKSETPTRRHYAHARPLRAAQRASIRRPVAFELAKVHHLLPARADQCLRHRALAARVLLLALGAAAVGVVARLDRRPRPLVVEEGGAAARRRRSRRWPALSPAARSASAAAARSRR